MDVILTACPNCGAGLDGFMYMIAVVLTIFAILWPVVLRGRAH